MRKTVAKKTAKNLTKSKALPLIRSTEGVRFHLTTKGIQDAAKGWNRFVSFPALAVALRNRINANNIFGAKGAELPVVVNGTNGTGKDSGTTFSVNINSALRRLQIGCQTFEGAEYTRLAEAIVKTNLISRRYLGIL